MYEGMIAESIRYEGDGGDLVDAYYARPLGPGPFPGVLVIHHNPGWDEATKEIARRFAVHGYAAISPHLFTREGAGTTNPQDASAAARAAGGVPDARMLADTDAALSYLRAQPYSNGKAGVIGYCSGGRQSYIVACNLAVDAAIVCYGGRIVVAAEDLTQATPVPAIDMTPGLSCPLLGLFGVEDRNPSPEQVAIIEAELKENGKDYEFHSYEDTGHSFFSVDRPAFRVESANDGWARIFDFYAKHLAGS